MIRMIESTRAHDYWDARCHVWYRGCASYECYIAPARDVTDDSGWAWWAGETVDPIAGGRGDVGYDDASLRGLAPTRAAATARAKAALRELADE